MLVYEGASYQTVPYMVVHPIEHCAFMPRQIIHGRLWRLSGGEARVKFLISPCQAPGVMEIQRLCGCGLFTTHRRRGFPALSVFVFSPMTWPRLMQRRNRMRTSEASGPRQISRSGIHASWAEMRLDWTLLKNATSHETVQ